MTIEYLPRNHAVRLAYCYTPPAESNDLPIVMFCGGYRSDMGGTKATYLEKQCQLRGQGYIRFDYSGHGESDGVFRKGTIGSWAEDALAILDHLAGERKVVLVGSSMGGWIALLLLKHRPQKIHALMGIAAAPDFTEEIYNLRMTNEQRSELMEKGIVLLPNDYSDEPYEFTKAFYEDGKAQCVLNGSVKPSCPIHLIQGKEDKDVEWETAERIKESFGGPDHVQITYIEDGDHRLSRDEDLELLDQMVINLSS